MAISFKQKMWRVNHQLTEEVAENRLLINLLFPSLELKGMFVFDAGCGRGGWSIAFGRKMAGRVVGVDISHSSLQTAVAWGRKNTVTSVRFAQSNLEYLPIRDDVADLVFCWGVLHYCEDPEKALRELCRICSPSGQIFLQAHKRTAATWFHDTARRIVKSIPRAVRGWVLELCVGFLLFLGLITGSKRLMGSERVRQKVAERWFYPGTLHSLRANDLLKCARKLGWAGQYVSLDHPNRYNPSNSFLLCFRKNSLPP